MTKHQPVADRQEQILRAALALFSRKGVGQTSMSDIVSESGLSKGGVYWHFKSKSDIIEGALQRFMVRDLSHIEKIAYQDESTARERLLAIATEMGRAIEALRPDLPLLIEVYGLAGRHPELRASLQRYYATYQDLLSVILEDGVRNNEFAEIDCQFVAWQIIAHSEGHFLLWMLNPQAALQDQLVSAIDLFVNGIAFNRIK